jgi:hypothetical protein
MAKIEDIGQVARNKKAVEDNSIDTGWNVQIEDGDADYGEKIFNARPTDRIGLLPTNKSKDR